MNKKPTEPKTLVENRRVRFDYHILETYTAGLILTGPEVCSIRNGKCNITEAFCYVDDSCQMKITNMYVTIPAGTVFQRDIQSGDERTLLLTKKEIQKIADEIKQTGITCVPIKIFRAPNGYLKILLGICKGKKEYDKRETIKARESNREMDRARKSFE